MTIFRTYFLLAATLLLAGGCKSKKKPSLSGDEPVEINDFIDFFPDKDLPYQFGDSTLNRKETDSLLISYNAFTQFVPDSFLVKVFGKTAKARIYPMGKMKGPGSENYL